MKSKQWAIAILGLVVALHLGRSLVRLWPAIVWRLACINGATGNEPFVFLVLDAIGLGVMWAWPQWCGPQRADRPRPSPWAIGSLWGAIALVSLPVVAVVAALGPQLGDWLGWLGLWAWAAYLPWHYRRSLAGRPLPWWSLAIAILATVVVGFWSVMDPGELISRVLAAIALGSWGLLGWQEWQQRRWTKSVRILVFASGLTLAIAIGSYFLSIPRPETFAIYAPAYRAIVQQLEQGKIALPPLPPTDRQYSRASIPLPCPYQHLGRRLIVTRQADGKTLASAEFVVFSIGLGDGSISVVYRADGRDIDNSGSSDLVYQRTRRLGDRWFWEKVIY
ncbi:MAG TPA: hypothetical protein V6D46_00090 [Coleofasciculaceae cyanobacterium]